jgi:hypothetical protein
MLIHLDQPCLVFEYTSCPIKPLTPYFALLNYGSVGYICINDFHPTHMLVLGVV